MPLQAHFSHLQHGIHSLDCPPARLQVILMMTIGINPQLHLLEIL